MDLPAPPPSFTTREPFSFFSAAGKEEAKATNVPVKSFLGTSLDRWRNSQLPPVLEKNFIQQAVKQADASGLGTREQNTAPINLSKNDRLARDRLNDLIPRSVIQIDNYAAGAHKFYYTVGDKVLRIDVLPLGAALRVCAEIMVQGNKETILYSISHSDSAELGVFPKGTRTGYNHYKSLCMTVKTDGTLEWFGDAMQGETATGTLVDHRVNAPKLIDLMWKIHEGTAK